VLLNEGFEQSTLGGFTASGDAPGWGPVATSVHSGYYSAFAPDLGIQSDQRLTSPTLIIPSGVTSATLTFWHTYTFDASTQIAYDGGVLEISSDSGATWNDAGALIQQGGYTGTLCCGNPLNGRAAWVRTAALGQVQVDLRPFAGQTIQFRFRLGTGTARASIGWWVDDIVVMVSGGALPTPTPSPTGSPPPPTATPCPVFDESFESGNLDLFSSVVPTCTAGGCGWHAVSTAAHSGTYAAFAPDSGGISDQQLVSPVIDLPPGLTEGRLTFWHRYAFLGIDVDGGVLEASTDGGATWLDAGPNIELGRYTGSLYGGYGNPLGGRLAWVDTNGARFTPVRVDLRPYAGHSFQFRFREGTQLNGTTTGWWIDDVRVELASSPCGGGLSTLTPTPIPFSPTPTPTPTFSPPCQWDQVTSPNPGQLEAGHELNAVAARQSDDVWTVGSYEDHESTKPMIQHWDGQGWQRLPLVPMLPFGGVLEGVAALAADDAWAVGWQGGGGSTPPFALAAHWDGTSWQPVTLPIVGSASILHAISARAADDIWAVGSADEQPLAYHWDGAAWAVVPPPQYGPVADLFGVSARAADDVWAVGTLNDQTLTLHWDGQNWNIISSPNVQGNGQLTAVTAVAADDVWAVGFYIDLNLAAPEQTVSHSLILHWDGQAWSTTLPTPIASRLYGVAALNAGAVWAVGTAGGGGTSVLRWDGSTWQTAPAPVTGAYGSRLTGMAALAPNDLWTVGAYASSTGATSLIAHYDTDWHVMRLTPPTIGGNQLNGVAALSAQDAWAVGRYAVDAQGYGAALMVHWDGTIWQVVPSGVPTTTWLNAVAARATDDVWAVGQGNGQTLTMHWDGQSWQQVPSPSVGQNDELFGVAALAADDAWAVGISHANGHTLALHWNGQIWTIVPTPASPNALYAMSARAPDDIWAVGTGIIHWDGQQWTQQTPPGFTNYLRGVVAIAADDVWVGGNIDTGSAWRVQFWHWDGVTWQRITAPAVGSYTGLRGMAARASDDVWAVGETDTAPANPTLIMHWDGARWAQVPSPAPGVSAIYYGVAAQATDDVWAVGTYDGGFRTLIAHYGGTCGGPATPTPVPASATPTRPPSATRTPPPTSQPSATVTPAATASPTTCAITFVDAPVGSTFYDYIECLACRGIVGGYPCGGPGEPCPGQYYRPNTNVTRGQTSKIVSEAAGLADPVPSTQQTFEDVVPGSTFWTWIERLAGRGIIGGYPCGGPGEPCMGPDNRPYFRPGNDVTRGQLAKIVAGAAGWTETPTGQTFEDVPPGSTFYLFVERVAGRGIVGGYPCGGPGEPCIAPGNRAYFRPANNATRGQMSKIAANAFFPNCATPSRR
jgi:hypothetical protein